MHWLTFVSTDLLGRVCLLRRSFCITQACTVHSAKHIALPVQGIKDTAVLVQNVQAFECCSQDVVAQ